MNIQLDKTISFLGKIAIAVIPLLIINGVLSAESGEKLDVTVFEWVENETSKIEVLIKNIGTSHAENTRVYVYTSYDYLQYKTTDSKPVVEKSDDERVLIERIAPQSFVKLIFEKPISNEEKTIWVTHNAETIFLPLQNLNITQGISSVEINKEKEDILMMAGGFAVFLVLGYRFLNYYTSEIKRKDFLGVHEIPPVKFRSDRLKLGLVILLISFLAGFAVDNYNNPNPVSDYKPYTFFNNTQNIHIESFNELKDPTQTFVSGGLVVFSIGLIIALSVSNKDINLPKFEWNLKPDPLTILIKQTTTSFLNFKIVTDTFQIDRENSNVEVYVVKKNNIILGLFNLEEIKDFDIGKKPKAKTILKNKELPLPHFNKEEKIRDNFTLINENKNLDELEKQMKEKHKRFAVIENNEHDVIGVLNYDDYFGKHISL